MDATATRYSVFRDGRWVEGFEKLRDARSAAFAMAWSDRKREYSVHEFRASCRIGASLKTTEQSNAL